MSKQEKMKTDGNLITRNEADFQLSTFREADNSVEFVLATENPAIIKDSTYGKCRESLMSDGVSLPPNNQVHRKTRQSKKAFLCQEKKLKSLNI